MEGELDIGALRAIAIDMLAGVGPGDPLTDLDRAMIDLGLAASVTSLDRDRIADTIARAEAAGATVQQMQEVISLVSGLGVHSLMASATTLLAAAERAGAVAGGPLDADRQALWDRHVGDDPFWHGFERELSGFLDAMLRLSPDQFSAFFDYCAVPWKSGSVRARLKELIAMASDATPTHRFLPGFRLHLANAIALGVGHVAILEALDLAAGAPPHRGTR